MGKAAVLRDFRTKRNKGNLAQRPLSPKFALDPQPALTVPCNMSRPTEPLTVAKTLLLPRTRY